MADHFEPIYETGRRAERLIVDGVWVGTVWENWTGVSWARIEPGVGAIEGDDGLSWESAVAALKNAVDRELVLSGAADAPNAHVHPALRVALNAHFGA